MIRKTTIFCTLASMMILFTCLYPAVISTEQIEKEKTITVETNLITGLFPQKTTMEMTESEIKELRQILNDLYEAIDNNNQESVEKYQGILVEKGVLNQKHLNFLKINNNNEAPVNSSYDISNEACLFKAVGSGFIAMPLETSVLEWIVKEASEEGGLGGIILVVLLSILFYIPVMLVTHLIPFRIGMLSASIQLSNGDMSSTGLKGRKTVEVNQSDIPARANLTFFTGITIGIPPISLGNTTATYESNEENSEDGFLFVYGWAAKVENA